VYLRAKEVLTKICEKREINEKKIGKVCVETTRVVTECNTPSVSASTGSRLTSSNVEGCSVLPNRIKGE
jgi:hypothetical protein